MAAIIIRGEDIRKARKARGLSLEKAAEQIGVLPSAIGNWEQGRNGPGPSSAKKLAAWLAQEPEAMPSTATASEPTISIPLPSKLAELAAELGVDVTSLFETKGMEAVREELKRLWQEQNKAAIAARNAYIEEHGLPFADLRVW